MPTTDEHLRTAEANRNTLDYLLAGDDAHLPWAATVAFYAAVHHVDAVLHHLYDAHGGNHAMRRTKLQRHRALAHIYRNYKQLDEASQIARYMQRMGDDDEDCTFFDEYYPPEDVRGELMDCLRKVIKSARHHLEKPRKSGLRDTR